MLRPAVSRISRPLLNRTIRPFSTTTLRLSEGDTGSGYSRAGGDRHADTWSRREKALEDMYIKNREKEIMLMLREKIAAQTRQLDKDRLILNQMEEHYGQSSEEEWSKSKGW